MNKLEYLQIFGVFLGLCQMIPSIYKNFKTRHDPKKTKAIDNLSYTSALIMVYSGVTRLPNLVKGLKDALISGDNSRIRRAVLILMGTTFTFITFYGTLMLMAFYYDTPTEKEHRELVRIRIGAGIYTLIVILIIYYFIHVLRTYA